MLGTLAFIKPNHTELVAMTLLSLVCLLVFVPFRLREWANERSTLHLAMLKFTAGIFTLNLLVWGGLLLLNR